MGFFFLVFFCWDLGFFHHWVGGGVVLFLFVDFVDKNRVSEGCTVLPPCDVTRDRGVDEHPKV